MNKTKIVQQYLIDQGATWLNQHGGADGIWGKATQKAYADYNSQFYNPPTYGQINEYYGKPDFDLRTHPNITYITPQYPMWLAWDTDIPLTRISVHEKLADSLTNILQDIYFYYGLEKIKQHGLDMFGGTLSVRTSRNSDHNISTHAYAAAIDLDPARNRLKWGKNQAYIPQYCPELFDIFRAYGWISLGEKVGYDYMHFQFVK